MLLQKFLKSTCYLLSPSEIIEIENPYQFAHNFKLAHYQPNINLFENPIIIPDWVITQLSKLYRIV